LPGIAFGVFVGENRAHRFEHSFGDEIFAGDELEAGSFAVGFVAEEIGDARIDGVERALHAVVGFGRGHGRPWMCEMRHLTSEEANGRGAGGLRTKAGKQRQMRVRDDG
jgi:hypothetical protein